MNTQIDRSGNKNDLLKDIATMLWKESRTLITLRGKRGQMVFSILPTFILAVFFPWSLGLDWANLYLPLFVTIFIPLVFVSITVPDSFAGERERHTLETLLSSRLSDRAILSGKLLGPVLGGWGMSLLVLLLSIITLNITHWQGKIVFYRPMIFLACLAAGLLIAVLAAALGVIFSIRAPTVQAAQQSLLTWLMLPPMLLGFIPLLLLNMPADVARRLSLDFLNTPNRAQFFAGLNGDLIVWSIIGLLFLAASGLLALTFFKFRRSRLILD